MELSGSVLEWDRPRPPAMNIYDVQHLSETLELVWPPQVHEVDLEVRAWSWCHDRAEQSLLLLEGLGLLVRRLVFDEGLHLFNRHVDLVALGGLVEAVGRGGVLIRVVVLLVELLEFQHGCLLSTDIIKILGLGIGLSRYLV